LLYRDCTRRKMFIAWHCAMTPRSLRNHVAFRHHHQQEVAHLSAQRKDTSSVTKQSISLSFQTACQHLGLVSRLPILSKYPPMEGVSYPLSDLSTGEARTGVVILNNGSFHVLPSPDIRKSRLFCLSHSLSMMPTQRIRCG